MRFLRKGVGDHRTSLFPLYKSVYVLGRVKRCAQFRFDIKDVLFGILDTDNISILVNYILLESKFFIYRYKVNKGSLCMRLLVDKFKKTFQTERYIAKEKQ